MKKHKLTDAQRTWLSQPKRDILIKQTVHLWEDVHSASVTFGLLSTDLVESYNNKDLWEEISSSEDDEDPYYFRTEAGNKLYSEVLRSVYGDSYCPGYWTVQETNCLEVLTSEEDALKYLFRATLSDIRGIVSPTGEMFGFKQSFVLVPNETSK